MNPNTNEVSKPLSTLESLLGRVLNEYKIVSLIKQTEKNWVFLSRDINLERYVALKILKPNQSDERERQFINEGKTLAKLPKDENIVQVFAARQEEGYHYIAMEYIEGEDLDDLIRAKKKFSLETILNLGIDLSRALMRAHDLGINHKDIKPANIKLTKNKSLKKEFKREYITCVIDFGGRLETYNSNVSTHNKGPPKNDVVAISMTLEQLLENRENLQEKIPEELEKIFNNAKQEKYKDIETFNKVLENYKKSVQDSKKRTSRRKFIKRTGMTLTTMAGLSGLTYSGKKYHHYLNSSKHTVNKLNQETNIQEIENLCKELGIRIFNEKIKKFPKGKFPYAISDQGTEWTLTDGTSWTSGFSPAIDRIGYQLTKNSKFEEWELESINEIEITERDWMNLNTIRFYYSHALKYDLTKDKSLKQKALKASEIMASRFNKETIFLPQNGTKPQNLYMDVMTTGIPLIAWAYHQTQDKDLKSKLMHHCNATMNYNVNSDGSTVQIRIIDPSNPDKLIGDRSHGFNEESCLSRGQARAIKGFSVAYKATGEPNYLETAEKCAKYFIDNLPPDNIPFYDFKDPHKDIPKDTSAATIGTSGLLDLFEITKNPLYRLKTLAILKSLSTRYLSIEPEYQGLLTQGCSNFNKGANIDCSLIYGDYYFLETISKI